MDHHHVLSQSDVSRQPVLVLEGYLHVLSWRGPRQGGQGSHWGMAGVHVTVWSLCTPCLANQATFRIYRHNFHWSMLVHGQSLQPLLQRDISLPKRGEGDTGTLPRAQAVPTGLHSTLSPKTAPKPEHWSHLRVLGGCWIAGAWLGGHRFGSFLIFGVRHCPPKPLNRAYIFFFEAPSIASISVIFFASKSEINGNLFVTVVV